MSEEKAVEIPKGWHIEYDPKPIPMRSHDYDFWHDDLDVGANGEGSNGLCGTAASREDALAQIAEIEEERAE